jgi:predicted metal-dependent HD superfamily phosphohydrolase
MQSFRTIKEVFQQLIAQYNSDFQQAETFWNEIESNYSHSDRHYHRLSHLEQMLSELLRVQTKIKDWSTVLFALFYHDIIYKPTSNHNEEKSAELAEARLRQIGYPREQIEKCKQIILATKTHIEFADPDINYFTDADLCILGQNWENYATYARNIRKEYLIYPDFIYNPGRKKVLGHFLAMKRIFKTNFFFEKFEKTARENLIRELDRL